ncbi:hypothetical protein COY26_05440 [Candidatus Woesearchaeota archaeon CG_4_10_14_0_2_um_filter_33_10]|nr:MAG: hypothetical protein COV14_02660 [Candidatus Woesearchaeota archaeon CG10_big_fil_rev_8_21_14_0_10_33_12]PIU72176.1 MAG: hypothetical protein COS79_04350 [Candidatus Woesearchaeota archaeon CG06_land_8_20_14_3_00_33_13]PIZ51845.1 MAG: hypothetical protein COY26_05440 [Candidatus Woesearchaeota archaeon CG_4_10_14_0_2_um_filter_33_10]
MESKFKDFNKSQNPHANRFHNKLKEKGTNFATGVPCGVLRYFINNFEIDKDFIHIPAQSEPEAVGIAAGAYLGSKIPVVYMQNSGMLKSTNEISSLLIPCEIPFLFVVTYRGCSGENAPQHLIGGKLTKKVLEQLGIFYKELEEDNIEETVSGSYNFINEKKKPAAILVKRGWCSYKGKSNETISEPKIHNKKLEYGSKNVINEILPKIVNRTSKYSKKMKREVALDSIINSTTSEDAIFSTTGLISRSLYERYDSPNQFYNVGSFGLVSSLGLGFAVSKPKTKTIVIDGDASILTNFGTLVTIGYNNPKNLTHIVLDNNAYASCTEERSCSDTAKIPFVAALQGYSSIYMVNTEKGLEQTIKESEGMEGPVLIYSYIELGGRRDFKRPLNLSYITKRFKNYFSEK